MVKIKGLFGKKAEGPLLHTNADLELFKHFKVVKTLGKGSFATVYEVQRLSDKRRYALKHISISSIPAAERQDLVNEIRLLASLDHPHLLRYYEAFTDHQQLFIITELVANGDLGTLIEKRAEYEDWLPERQIWSYFIQLALGIQYLHHNHVLHRDIKPQNVLITEGNIMKIADLGISQMLDHVFTRVLCGTPQYVSPEMWRRQPYSYSADIWALGCILHEMCSLKPLFLASSDREIRTKVLSGLLDSIPPRYSIDLWDVIRLMLTPDPAERPTIDEILAMPQVQARMSLLPAEDQPYLDPAHDDHAKILEMIRISTRFDKWDQLNDLLPPSKYPNGPGVVESLRMRRPTSCPELTKLADDDASWEGQAEGGWEPRPSGSRRGSRGRLSLEGVAGAGGGGPWQQWEGEGEVHHSSSCPRLDGWEQDEPARRRSIAVGEMLYHRKKEAELAAEEGSGGQPKLSAAEALMSAPSETGACAGGGGGSGSPGTAGSLGGASLGSISLGIKRTKSQGEILASRTPRRIGSSSSSRYSPWSAATQAPFDPSPVEFGGGGGGQHGSSAGRDALLRVPACGGGVLLSSSGVVRLGGGGGGGGKQGGGGGGGGAAAAAGAAGAAVRVEPRVHAATMIACHMGEGPPAPASVQRSSGDSARSGPGPGSGGGAGQAQQQSQQAQQQHAATVGAAAGGGLAGGKGEGGGKKEKKQGRVKFKSRLKQLFFGDDHGGAMHQPLW